MLFFEVATFAIELRKKPCQSTIVFTLDGLQAPREFLIGVRQVLRREQICRHGCSISETV